MNENENQDALKDVTVVTLDEPLVRASGESIRKIEIRKPNTGALRGLALSDLLRLQTEAIQTIIPRISTPMVLKQEVAKLDPADLVALGMAVVGFLVPKNQRADFQLE